MRASLIVLLLVLVSAQHLELIQQIKQNKKVNPADEYANEIIQLLELEVEVGSPLEEIVEYIQDMVKQIKADAVVEETESLQKIGMLNADINVLEHQVESLAAQLKAANTKIVDVSTEIGSLQQSLDSLSKQLSTFNGKEEEIRDTRRVEQSAGKQRENVNDSLIEALNQIIDKLSKAVLSSKQGQASVLTELERKTYLRTLKNELGEKNPVTLLVSLTTTFDVPTVTRIIQKLEVIRQSAIEQQASASAAEVTSQQNFDTMVKELTEVREKLNTDYKINQRYLLNRNNEKVLAQRLKSKLEVDLPFAQQSLLGNQEQLERVNLEYISRRFKRESEIKVLESVLQLVKRSAHSH